MAAKSVLGGASKGFGSSVSGAAALKIVGDNVRVKFHDKEFNGKTTEGKKYHFTRKDLPKSPKFAGDISEDFYVRLNKDEDAIDYIAPMDGMFTVKLVDFTRPDGEDKPPRFVEDEKAQERYQKKEPVFVFTAHLLVTSGDFKGVKLYKKLHYKFTDDGEGNTMFTFDPAQAKQKRWARCVELIKFLEVAELASSPIEWPEDGNVLPELLERAEENGVKFNVVIENGWIQNFLDIKAYSKQEEESDEIDDEPIKENKSEKEIVTKLGYDDEM